MAALGLGRTDIDPSNDEADVEEVVRGVGVTGRKWSTEKDELLISCWINCSTDPTVGTNKKRSSFWSKIAMYFNEHRPQGSARHFAKTCNGRWLRCCPLVNKWIGILLEIEHLNESGSNEVRILEKAHELYKMHMGKKFELEHWYAMLKDKPKWKKVCDPTEIGSGSKRSNPDSVEDGDEVAGGSERPEGRKAAKRKSKQKASNTVVEMVTTHFKDYNATNNDYAQSLKGLVEFMGDKVAVAKEAVRIRDDRDKIKSDVSMKKADAIKSIADGFKIRAEAKLRKASNKKAKYEDSMLIDTSMMNPIDAAFYEEKKAAIRMKRLGQSSSHE